MFDVGFLEVMMICVLALLVLGPERLPKAAQKMGYWFGKARRYVEGIKEQVTNEFDDGELKRLLHNQNVQIRELQSKLDINQQHINSEYHNMFDDKEDPGTDPEPVEESRYEILEEDEFDELEVKAASDKTASDKAASDITVSDDASDSSIEDKAKQTAEFVEKTE